MGRGCEGAFEGPAGAALCIRVRWPQARAGWPTPAGCGAERQALLADLQRDHGLADSLNYVGLTDQGSNPGPLHWRTDSYPLSRQGSPGADVIGLSPVAEHTVEFLNHFQLLVLLSADRVYRGDLRRF